MIRSPSADFYIAAGGNKMSEQVLAVIASICALAGTAQ